MLFICRNHEFSGASRQDKYWLISSLAHWRAPTRQKRANSRIFGLLSVPARRINLTRYVMISVWTWGKVNWNLYSFFDNTGRPYPIIISFNFVRKYNLSFQTNDYMNVSWLNVILNRYIAIYLDPPFKVIISRKITLTFCKLFFVKTARRL